MPSTEFTADQFSPTKWETAERKVGFAKAFVRFVESDFNFRHFTQTFYTRLALAFGNIAHYNRHGFFETFFTTTAGKVRFLRQTLAYPCCGEPAFTYSDAERALQSWLFQTGVLDKYEKLLAEEAEAKERAELDRLQKKYGG